MHKHRLLLSIILLPIFITYHCCAMEAQQSSENFIAINNGLLTEVEAKIAQTDYVGFLVFNRSITGTTIKKDTLINLIRYQRNLDNSKGGGPYEIFCPILLKETNGFIEDLGQFNPHQHKEAKEAMRENRAVYCIFNQGAIIYNITKQPSIEKMENAKTWIEQFQKQHNKNVIIPSK